MDPLKPLRKRLSKLDLDEISLVPAGDNPPAKVVVAKADKTHEVEEAGRSLNDSDTPQGASMDPEISKDELPEDVVAYIEALEAELDRASVIEDLAAALESGASVEIEAHTEVTEEAADEDLVLAKADPEVRSLIEKAEQRAEEAERIAKEERDLRLQREYVAKAHTLPMLPGTPDEKAEVIKALHEADPALAERVEGIFAAANEQIAKGNLFTEFGSATPVETVGDVAAQRAAEIAKSDPTLTPEQAMVKAMEADPTLYDRS